MKYFIQHSENPKLWVIRNIEDVLEAMSINGYSVQRSDDITGTTTLTAKNCDSVVTLLVTPVPEQLH